MKRQVIKSLRAKFLIRFIPLIVAAVCVTAAIAVYIFVKYEHSRVEDQLMLSLNSIEGEIDELGSDLVISANATVAEGRLQETIRNPSLQNVLDLLQNLQKLTHSDTVALLDDRGIVVAEALRLETIGSNVSSKALYQKTIESGTSQYGIEQSAEGLSVTVFTPLIDDEGRVFALEIGHSLDFNLISRIKERHGIDVTIFAGKRLQTTTFTDTETIKNSSLHAIVSKVEQLRKPIIEDISLAGTKYALRVEPIFTHDRKILGAIALANSYSQTQQAVKYVIFSVITISTITIMLAVFFCLKLSFDLVRPIRALSAVSRKIAQGDFNQKVTLISDDEIGELGRAFNKMTKELKQNMTSIETLHREIAERESVEAEKAKLETQLRQAEKMEAIGTLAGGIAHDFNNILMGVQGRTSLLMMDAKFDYSNFEHLAAIEEYVQSASHLTGQLLGISRGGKYNPTPVDLNEIVDHSCSMYGRTRKEIEIITKLHPEPLIIEADQRQIEQVLLNIYVNAYQAMPSGGELSLSTTSFRYTESDKSIPDLEPGEYAKLSISDTGVGMDQDTMSKIFDPFFTTKDKDRGTGLGLSSAFGIIENHGGKIIVYSELGHGSIFEIFLPLSDSPLMTGNVDNPELRPGTETILLVDDEKMIIDVGSQMLEKLGYSVIVANSGSNAVEIIDDKGEGIDLVILDMIMPGMDGDKVFHKIRGKYPNMPIVLASGYSLDGQANSIMRNGCNGFIQKPFTLTDLSNTIRSVLGTAKSPQ